MKPEQYFKWLSPNDLLFRKDGERIVLERDGVTCEDIGFRCAFPLSDPHRYILIKDSEGAVIGMLRDLADLKPDQRTVVKDALREIYFIPIIEKIEKVEEQFGVTTWHVVTDRGPRTFKLRGRTENVLEVAPGRVLITDVDLNRYEIAPDETLDPASRAHLIRLL